MPNFIVAAMTLIPKEIWPVASGALIAIAGSAFTTWRNNTHARKMLDRQLRAAAQQAEDKRTLDLKRDIFLPAVTGASRALSAIGNMSNLSVPDKDILSEIAKSGREINGVHAVGSERTVEQTLLFTTRLAEAMSLVAVKRAVAMNLQARVQAAWQTVENETANGAAVAEQMKRYNLHGASNDQWAAVKLQEHAHLSLISKWREEAKGIEMRFNDSAIALLDTQMAQLAELSPLQTNALISIREDLHLPIDAEKYIRLVTASTNRLMEIQADAREQIIRSF